MEYLHKSIRKTEYTEVYVLEDSFDDLAGATHDYLVTAVIEETAPIKPNELLKFSFQRGPIKENGVNGVQNEDLIAICIDRLKHFQAGKFSCRENALALTKLEEALLWLEKRTFDRKSRNAEGLSI